MQVLKIHLLTKQRTYLFYFARIFGLQKYAIYSKIPKMQIVLTFKFCNTSSSFLLDIYFQIINLSPWDISLKKGDVIGQGILLPYFKTNDDATTEERLGGFGSTDNDK